MLLWLLAGLPGAVFWGGILGACALPVLGWPSSAVAGSGAGLLFLLIWGFVLPQWTIARALKGLEREVSPELEQSWKRAFDGLPHLKVARVAPTIFVWKSPIPALFVWTTLTGRHFLLVSRGWLFERGEEGFRKACRQAVLRMRGDALKSQTRTAFMLSYWASRSPRSFWNLLILARPQPAHSAEAGLSAGALLLGLPTLVWMRWIVGLTRGMNALKQRPALGPEGSGRPSGLKVDWPGRSEPWLVPLEQILSTEQTGWDSQPEKSILSWIPAR